MKKILIGIGDSKFAEHATEYGFNLARSLKAHVGLIHITEAVVATPTANADTSMGIPFDSMADMMPPELLHIQDDQAKKMITAAIKNYGDGVQITSFSDYGDTADGILSCAKEFDADMIVIGTHSRTGIDRFLMGSVAEHVVRHAAIPVLVVPMPGQ